MVEEEVWQTVTEMNKLWTEGDGSGLERYFHPEMVAIAANSSEWVEGGAACVASWQGFARSVKTLKWKSTDQRVRVFGYSAVVAYRYEMECDFGGKVVRLKGRDTMTLLRHEGRWMVVADHFSSEPGEKG